MEEVHVTREPKAQPSQLKILVVDDEEIMRNMLKDVLTDAGYMVFTACDGKEAIEKFTDQDLSIVITDIRMPGMDGVEVTRKFKETRSDVCVIAITGYASIDSAVAILKEGAYDYINKPFNIDEIKIVVARAAERQSLLIAAKEKEKYQQLSIVDGLTELYNRRYFDEMIVKELEKASRYNHHLSFMIVDADHFKKFNDTNGHQAGDWALKRFAQIVAGSIRTVDYAFRYGGEEFAVILPETDKVGAIAVAKRFRLNVSLAKFLDSKAMPTAHMTASIGLATFPEDAKEAQELIHRADENLYAAKELGRDRICFLGIEGTRREVK
jgi:diguanylate cyclase (GGDEF)-like protein